MMHRKTRASRIALSSALALLVATPMAASAQDARIHLDGLQFQEQHDQFIVKYRDDSESFRSSARRAKSLQIASSGVSAKLQPLRRLAVGADVVKAGRKLDRVEAEAVMRAIASDPAVEYVEVDARMRADLTPNDDYYTGYQWGYQHPYGGTHANWAWNRARGRGVVVAVIDTGRTPHPDLSPNMVDGYDFLSNRDTAADGNGRDGNATDPGDWVRAGQCGRGEPAEDSSWHGTHVAGTVAAVTNNNRGVAGMAFGAKVQPIRALGKCGGPTSDIADAIVWASGGDIAGVPRNRTPAEVINLSLGGGGACSQTFQRAIDRAVRRGTVVVVAAGNGDENVNRHQPANCARVVAVGATGRGGARAPYSNFGAKIDVSAPGGSGGDNAANWILSTHNNGRRARGAPVYGYLIGTSMAAPHVAGTVALMQDVRVRSPAQVEQLLKQTARPFPRGCGSNCGRGIVNAEAAVNALLGRYYAVNTNRAITEGAGQIAVPMRVSRAGNAPASLRVGVYIRHPRPADLIVALQAPDGTYYRLHTNTATGIPGINNTYTVNASAEPASGQWRLTMRDDRSGQVGALDRWTLQF